METNRIVGVRDVAVLAGGAAARAENGRDFAGFYDDTNVAEATTCFCVRMTTTADGCSLSALFKLK